MNDNATIYQQAIEKWGVASQVTQAMEEAGELITVSNKFFFRGIASAEDVAGEIADNIIMLEQLTELIGRELVDNAKQAKLERLKETLRGKG